MSVMGILDSCKQYGSAVTLSILGLCAAFKKLQLKENYAR